MKPGAQGTQGGTGRSASGVLKAALQPHEAALDEMAAGIFSGSGSAFRELVFYKHFGQARRRFGEAELALDAETTSQLEAIYPGFDPRDWSVATLVRVWLMNRIPLELSEPVLDRLFQHSELGELQAIFRGLYTLPNHGRFASQLAEGVRTNMVAIFEAIAMANPLAARLLDDTGWAQLVLKAVFMDRPLYRILGLDERRSLALALTASDYAHERWAAGRSVTPELWRLTAAFDHDTLLEDATRAAQSENWATAQAGRLALRQMPTSRAQDRLESLPPVEQALGDWVAVGQHYEANKTTGEDVQVLYPSRRRPEVLSNAD